MYQHTVGNIIGMVILNLEVINGYRSFKDFMLDLLDNDVFTVDKNQNVTCTKMNGSRPALYRGIEGMGRCTYDLFTIYEYMDKLVGFVDVGLNNFLKSNVSGFFIPCPDIVAPKPLYRPTRSPYASQPPPRRAGRELYCFRLFFLFK